MAKSCNINITGRTVSLDEVANQFMKSNTDEFPHVGHHLIERNRMAVHHKTATVKRSLSWPLQNLGQPKNGVTIYTTEECATILQKLHDIDNKLGRLSFEVQDIKSKRPVPKKSSVSRRKKNVSRKKIVNRGKSSVQEPCTQCEHQKQQTKGKELWMKSNFQQDHTHFLKEFLACLLTDFNTKEIRKRKSTIVKDVHSKDTNCEMLLDSFMYRDYFNDASVDRKNVALHPIIATSRNFDEFVAKKLSSGTRQSTNHRSEETSRSNESLSSPIEPHSMNLELVRLETFKNFPNLKSVSAVKLAKEGFFYKGEGADDLVICFACKSEKRGWRDGDVPREIHRQIAPECPLLNEHSANVPVGGSLNSPNGSIWHQNTEQIRETPETSETTRNHQPANSEQVNKTSMCPEVERNHQHSDAEQVNESSPRTRQQSVSNSLRTENGRHSNEIGVESTVEQASGNVSGSPTLNHDHLVPVPNRNTERSEPLSSQNNQGTESLSNPSHKRSRAIQEQINAFLRNLDPLGINFDRARYPSYAVLATRVSSFQDWPTSLTQTPQVLALAGFFYAGYGDYTRCFFCGGGLRNWEPGDDPWTEHARWFPKCAFVRQNKGDEFVALVQIRHQELEALEAMGEGATAASSAEQNSSALGNGELSSGSRQSDISAFPSFQSVQEMGYPESEIREAFNQLRGTKDAEDITGMDLMEVILSKEERNNGLDIPPPIFSSKPNNENPSRNPSVDQNAPDISQGGQCEAATGAIPQETPESGVQGETQKNQGEDAVTSNTEEQLDSLNDALAPAMSLEDTRSLMEENRKLRDLRMCKICMEKDASIAMLPCGHLCCCTDCAPAMRKCPICRQFVKGTVRTWLA